jgi:hypothetical protein
MYPRRKQVFALMMKEFDSAFATVLQQGWERCQMLVGSVCFVPELFILRRLFTVNYISQYI